MTSASISPTLKAHLKRLKLSPMLQTLPERLTLARQQKTPHESFLELVLADEVMRRDRLEAKNRAAKGGLDPSMVVEAWDGTAQVTYDKSLWAELTTLRFLEAHHDVLLLGPVGVGKTFLGTALGHIACRRGCRVRFVQTDKMLKLLKASRLDQTYEATLRQLITVDLLILDDFALDPMDAIETRDLGELLREKHRRTSLIVTSNRDPGEWLAMMAEPLRAQSAIDRLKNNAYELIIEGESYRDRQKPKWPPGQTT
ncbi:MAG: ATP-binding protein [Myxococcales bacterium]|nr:ATP-binding protein [Myxococcales bacterium]